MAASLSIRLLLILPADGPAPGPGTLMITGLTTGLGVTDGVDNSCGPGDDDVTGAIVLTSAIVT